jgi:adenylate kinase
MIILITGTPGVGKTTVSNVLKEKLDAHLISINELVEKKHLYYGIHKEKKYKIVDMASLFHELDILIEKINRSNYIIVEGHLSHFYQTSDVVIVLRANPDVLRKRMEFKDWNDAKIKENLEVEALGICSYESQEIHGEKANEIDTSNLLPDEVSDVIIKVLKGEKKFPVGNVDFLEYLM